MDDCEHSTMNLIVVNQNDCKKVLYDSRHTGLGHLQACKIQSASVLDFFVTSGFNALGVILLVEAKFIHS